MINKTISLLLIGSLSGLCSLICCLMICVEVSAHSCSDKSNKQQSEPSLIEAAFTESFSQSKLNTTNNSNTKKCSTSTATSSNTCSTNSAKSTVNTSVKSSCCKKTVEPETSTKACAQTKTPVKNLEKKSLVNKATTVKSFKTFSQAVAQSQPVISAGSFQSINECSSSDGCCCIPQEDEAELPVLPRINTFAAIDADHDTNLPAINSAIISPSINLIKPPRLINNEGRYLRCCVFLI